MLLNVARSFHVVPIKKIVLPMQVKLQQWFAAFLDLWHPFVRLKAPLRKS